MNFNNLRRFHKSFLKLPYENISLYLKKRPPKISEIKEISSIGFGGDCYSLAKYAVYRLNKIGINSKIIHFYNNLESKKPSKKIIKNMYHVAVMATMKDSKYILDYGFQIEEPILLKKGHTIRTKTKNISVGFDGVDWFLDYKEFKNKTRSFSFNENFNWTNKENEILARNLYNRNKSFKYAILKKNKIICFIQDSKDLGRIISKNLKSESVIYSGKINDCIKKLGLPEKEFNKAKTNFECLIC